MPSICYAIGAGKIVCLTLSFTALGTIRAMAQIRDIKSGRFGAPPRDPMPRRLAAIVAGDISGYSRLMQIDEEGTHNRVKRIERDLIEPSIVEHHGRLVKTTGDGFIAIFDSPVEAVRCSIVIQQHVACRGGLRVRAPASSRRAAGAAGAPRPPGGGGAGVPGRKPTRPPPPACVADGGATAAAGEPADGPPPDAAAARPVAAFRLPRR